MILTEITAQFFPTAILASASLLILLESTSSSKQGHAGAQYSLGDIYYHGVAVLEDKAAAASWYRKAAEQGRADAQFNLALMYYRGEGVPADDVETYVWLTLADANGEKNASEGLAELSNRMTPEQLAQAKRKAAELWERLPR